MAIPMIKSTYSLDPDTVRALAGLARRWRVSKSEALRRAIRAASGARRSPAPDTLAALDLLQRSLNLDRRRTVAWAARVKTERRATASRRVGRRP